MSRVFVIAIALMIALGAFFRFENLAAKLYTNDEATTSVHVSGHTIDDYLKAARSGKIRDVAGALRFQHIDPKTHVRDVVASLANEDPQHPPLFYVLERGWQSVFGNSIVARRTLPALWGVLALGCAFWFALVLLDSVPFALVFSALLALSPFHEVYAQQAREYSLWTVLVLVSSALLVRALRSASQRVWILYALTLAAGLYTDLLFTYTLASHALFVVLAYRARFRRAFVPFACAAAAAVLAFAPWIGALYRGRSLITNNAYLNAPLDMKLFALKWVFNAGSVFYDFDYERHVTALLLVPIFAVVATGGVLLWRRADRRAALFVACLFATTALALLLPDIAQHQSRSTSSRYLIPTWLACECAVAYAIATWFESARERVRYGSLMTLGAFALLGLLSIGVSIRREYWWGDASVAAIGPIARAVRATSGPVTVVFADDHPVWDFAPMLLANEVSPEVGLVFLGRGEPLPYAAPHGKTLFALDPTQSLLAQLARAGWQARAVYRAAEGSDDLALLRRQAAQERGASGFIELPKSLWRLQ